MIEAAHADLLRAGVVTPVDLGGADERLWLDCDLASLAENRLGDRTDPHGLDEARRAEWQAKATTERPYSLAVRGKFERCYWLLEGGERAGTLSIGTSTVGTRSLRLASFYVFPSHRGRGVGQHALARVEEALGQNDLGLRLDTCWSWQRTVRFYMAAGLWVYMWKRDLTLSWDAQTPRPIVEIGEREATLSVARGADRVLLARARRRGDALELDEPPRKLQKDRRIGEAYWQATSTLSLALALAGWPPEALAHKITVWEAWDRHHGWRVETPRIPGLAYPTWTELTARWEAELATMAMRQEKDG
jgi:GNAT superfamily N-acetyltransferase